MFKKDKLNPGYYIANFIPDERYEVGCKFFVPSSGDIIVVDDCLSDTVYRFIDLNGNEYNTPEEIHYLVCLGKRLYPSQ